MAHFHRNRSCSRNPDMKINTTKNHKTETRMEYSKYSTQTIYSNKTQTEIQTGSRGGNRPRALYRKV